MAFFQPDLSTSVFPLRSISSKAPTATSLGSFRRKRVRFAKQLTRELSTPTRLDETIQTKRKQQEEHLQSLRNDLSLEEVVLAHTAHLVRKQKREQKKQSQAAQTRQEKSQDVRGLDLRARLQSQKDRVKLLRESIRVVQEEIEGGGCPSMCLERGGMGGLRKAINDLPEEGNASLWKTTAGAGVLLSNPSAKCA